MRNEVEFNKNGIISFNNYKGTVSYKYISYNTIVNGV